MKLVIGQGNPGDKYTSTRHNVGWLILDKYAHDQKIEFVNKPKFQALIAEFNAAGEKVLLVKPTTFYNETGISARTIADFYKIDTQDILAVHDDVALPLGSLRVRDKGSDAGNNGIKSLNAHLGQAYWRLKVGIYNPLRERMHDADFVLGRFGASEVALLNKDVYQTSHQVIEEFIANQLGPTSFNVLPQIDRAEVQPE